MARRIGHGRLLSCAHINLKCFGRFSLGRSYCRHLPATGCAVYIVFIKCPCHLTLLLSLLFIILLNHFPRFTHHLFQLLLRHVLYLNVQVIGDILLEHFPLGVLLRVAVLIFQKDASMWNNADRSHSQLLSH